MQFSLNLQQSNGKIRVAVIGAGAAGLCAGKHLSRESERFQFDIFEQQDEVGGSWLYSPRVGKDEFRFPVQSSMYNKLRTNLPKEVMAFPDFLYPHCDGQSFLPHTQVLQYLKCYAQCYDLYKYIRFRKFIENVRPKIVSDDVIEWRVSYSDIVTKKKETKIYDAVMVCNGRYSVPYVPDIEGLSEFEGFLMHSHSYREDLAFKDLKVVVLGAGASGLDIALEISAVAQEVVLSHNLPTKQCPLPGNVRQEKGIQSVAKSSVTFIGGKKEEFDAILLCTGYRFHYPFIDPSCNLKIRNQEISPLFLHTFLVDFPTLAIWGVPKLVIPIPLYDQQAKVFLKFLKGIINLPSRKAMLVEAERNFFQECIHAKPGDLLCQVDDDLCKIGLIDPIPDAIRNLFKHVHQRRDADLMNYKNFKYCIVNDKTFVPVE